MDILRGENDFYTNVERALSELDINWPQYTGLIIVGSHKPENIELKLDKIKWARETGTPFLGVCLGHQLAAIEYARNVLGIQDATSQEFGQGTWVVKKRPNLKVGLHEGESFWNNYEVDLPNWEKPPHFFTSQSHPEYQSASDRPHPLLANFLMAARSATVKSILTKVESEMKQGIKDIMADDIWPETVPFVLAKVNLTKKVYGQHGIKTQFRLEKKFFTKGWRIMAMGWLLHHSGLFNKYQVIKALDIFLKLPTKLKPKWYLTMDGHKIYMNEGDRSMRSILQDYRVVVRKHSVWEPETTSIVKSQVKEGNICLDIGASIGYFTMLFARQVGTTGKVLAFEPTTNQIPYLIKNVRKNGYQQRVQIFNVGAWDKTDQVNLPVNASIKYPSQCVAVDDVLEAQGINHVDFIKIDVDGPETRVLQGLRRTFEKNPNLKMVIEYYPEYIKNAGDNPEQFMQIINQYFSYQLIPGDYTDNCWNLFCQRMI